MIEKIKLTFGDAKNAIFAKGKPALYTEDGDIKHYEFLGNNSFLGKEKGFEDNITVQKKGAGYIVTRVIENITQETLHLKELSFTFDGLALGGVASEDYFYSVENPRLYGNYTLPIDLDRVTEKNISDFPIILNKKYADPEVICDRVCSGPYQPFPGILIGNPHSDLGLVIGSLSQDVFYHNFMLSHVDGYARCIVYSSFKDIAFREVKPGEILKDIWYIGESQTFKGIDHVFDEYVKELRIVLKENSGASDINRYSLIWDSWNDGIFRNVSESMLLAEAKAVKELFPNVEWFQLDDGYASYAHENVDFDAHGLGVPYEKNGVDLVKFPNGLKGYTDKIKALGLRPSIWIGGWVPMAAELYKDHKDWFIDYSYRLSRTQPLDVSLSCVRDYMKSALDVFFYDYGFEGVKHDFWSYAFEDRHDLLKNKDKSGYEYREWWHKEMRSHLPAGGYMETACDIGMGNPFLGKYFNNYRCGMDIQSGNWDNLVYSMLWSVGYLSTHTGDLFIPNSDSVGMLSGLTDRDFKFWLSYVLISRSMVEISGHFANKERLNVNRLKMLQKATCNINNGQDVFSLGLDFTKVGRLLPPVRYIHTPHFSREENNVLLPARTVALFNEGEEEKSVSFDFSAVGLNDDSYLITDVWTGEQQVFTKSVRYTLEKHGCRLLAISGLKTCKIIDSNIGLYNVSLKDKILTATVEYGRQAVLTVTSKVKNVQFENKDIPFVQKGNILTFSVEKAGNLTLELKD